ncbi:MAG: thiamine ABC transporter substrate-binding protein [Sediminispirochaetaceae bacterium]
MKKALIITAVLAAAVVLAVVIITSNSNSSTENAGEPQSAEPAKVVVYAYDSFVSEWGPGPVVAEAFEAEYGIPVELVSAGDGAQVLQKAVLEKGNPRADVLVGIDNNLLSTAIRQDVLEPYRSLESGKIDPDLIFDEEFYVTPYDYGYFSIIYDTEKIDEPPRTMQELTDPRFKDQLILMDPRTSTPGLGFLMWSVHRYGEDFTCYWENLESSILTITEGWDSGYGLFTSGEAPMVLSYTTSPAYHVEYEDSTRYQAAVFEDGHYMQIEGMGVVKGAPHPDAARKFIDFALSDSFQSVIPLTNWMYPVVPGTELPASFEYAPEPEKSFYFPSAEVLENRESWIDEWSLIVTN